MKLYADIWPKVAWEVETPAPEEPNATSSLRLADVPEIQRQLAVLLRNLTYFELPEKVRSLFENHFATVLQQYPDAFEYVRSVRIDLARHTPPYGDKAEYFKDTNRMELYKGWEYAYDYDWEHRGQSIPADEQERVKEEVIEKYFSKAALHELVHTLQNYFKQQGLSHPTVAPYPNEEHPEYYNFGEMYRNDPGEIQAQDLEDSLSSLKLSWEVEPKGPEMLGWRVRITHTSDIEPTRVIEGVVIAVSADNVGRVLVRQRSEKEEAFTIPHRNNTIEFLEYIGPSNTSSLKLSMARFVTPAQLLKLYNKYKKGYDYTKEVWEVREKVLYAIDMLIQNWTEYREREFEEAKNTLEDESEFDQQTLFDTFYQEIKKKHPNAPFTGQGKRFVNSLQTLADTLRTAKEPFDILVGIDKILNVIHDMGPIGVMLIHGFGASAPEGFYEEEALQFLETLNTIRDW